MVSGGFGAGVGRFVGEHVCFLQACLGVFYIVCGSCYFCIVGCINLILRLINFVSNLHYLRSSGDVPMFILIEHFFIGKSYVT